jgi:hypothetical protein
MLQCLNVIDDVAGTRVGLLPVDGHGLERSNALFAAVDRSMRPLLSRVQLEQRLLREVLALVPVRIGDTAEWRGPYRGALVPAVSETSANMKQMRTFMPV